MKRRFFTGNKIYLPLKLISRKEYQDQKILKMELHKEIASWLSKFKLIPPNSKALSINSEIEDLVAIIRDGVVLCQLVHSLDPGCLDMTRVIYDTNVHGDPAVSDFVCRSNIFLFLKAITSNFNLSVKQYWFDPEDLYLCRNIARVFSTLSALSHTSKLKKSGVEGFPKKEKYLAERLEHERNTYQDLTNIYGEKGTEQVYESFVDNQKSIYSTYGNEANLYGTSGADAYYAGKIGEDIYHTIFPPKAPRLGLNISAKKKKRQFHINELVDTEDKYLEKLIMVRDKFRERLTLMQTADKKVIFYFLDELILLHSDLLFDLRPKKVDMGLMFLRHLPRISALYGRYCVNLPQALERLHHGIDC
jgi:guanine nucleotide exchange factor VAV